MSKAIQTKHYNSKINIWDKVEFNIIEQKSMRETPTPIELYEWKQQNQVCKLPHQLIMNMNMNPNHNHNHNFFFFW